MKLLELENVFSYLSITSLLVRHLRSLNRRLYHSFQILVFENKSNLALLPPTAAVTQQHSCTMYITKSSNGLVLKNLPNCGVRRKSRISFNGLDIEGSCSRIHALIAFMLLVFCPEYQSLYFIRLLKLCIQHFILCYTHVNCPADLEWQSSQPVLNG